MTRLDRVAIILVITLVVPQLFSHVPSFDSGDGRRPLPGDAATAPPSAPLTPPADRVRRPLPEAAPNDPLFSVKTESLGPGEIALGTSFPVAAGTWLTARHLANDECQRLIMVVNGLQVAAAIVYLHPDSDLAVLKTPDASGPPLPLEIGAVAGSETGFSFGFPQGQLGATEDQLLGRSRMKLGGEIQGVGPMLSWAESARFPDALPALEGMSGGPMLDPNGKVVGIMVAASIRRGRVHTVAPEVLEATENSYGIADEASRASPAREVEGAAVSLGDAVGALDRENRITKTYCVPAS